MKLFPHIHVWHGEARIDPDSNHPLMDRVRCLCTNWCSSVVVMRCRCGDVRLRAAAPFAGYELFAPESHRAWWEAAQAERQRQVEIEVQMLTLRSVTHRLAFGV